MRRFTAVLYLFVASLAIAGCSDNQNTEVTDIYTSNSSMEIGEPAIFQIDFDYNSSDVFDDGDTVSLVVKVPAQLEYLRNSARLNQWGSDDLLTTPYVRKCLDGTTYLAFVFDDNDLDDGQSDGNSDAQLSVTLVANRPGQEVTVEATAALNGVSYGCREDFVADQQETVDIQ